MYLCIILKTILCLPHIIYDIVSMIEIKILQNLILVSLFCFEQIRHVENSKRSFYSCSWLNRSMFEFDKLYCSYNKITATSLKRCMT